MAEDQQLAEYQSQLADVEEMLAADPTDASLTKLRDDLTELIALTKGEEEAAKGDAGRDGVMSPDDAGSAQAAKLPPLPPPPAEAEAEAPSDAPAAAAAAEVAAAAFDANNPPKKKKKSKSLSSSVPSSFEVPDHLKPLPSDTDAERKRKSRTVKALKSKWRERRKEAEGIAKQRSWQDFTKKAKKRSGKGGGGGGGTLAGLGGTHKRERSIFATEDGVGAKVGVISGTTGVRGGMTEFDGRKRHKH